MRQHRPQVRAQSRDRVGTRRSTSGKPGRAYGGRDPDGRSHEQLSRIQVHLVRVKPELEVDGH